MAFDEKRKMIVSLVLAGIVGFVLAGPVAEPHHHYKERIHIHEHYHQPSSIEVIPIYRTVQTGYGYGGIRPYASNIGTGAYAGAGSASFGGFSASFSASGASSGAYFKK